MKITTTLKVQIRELRSQGLGKGFTKQPVKRPKNIQK